MKNLEDEKGGIETSRKKYPFTNKIFNSLRRDESDKGGNGAVGNTRETAVVPRWCLRNWKKRMKATTSPEERDHSKKMLTNQNVKNKQIMKMKKTPSKTCPLPAPRKPSSIILGWPLNSKFGQNKRKIGVNSFFQTLPAWKWNPTDLTSRLSGDLPSNLGTIAPLPWSNASEKPLRASGRHTGAEDGEELRIEGRLCHGRPLGRGGISRRQGVDGKAQIAPWGSGGNVFPGQNPLTN